jgi:hypothetical protein
MKKWEILINCADNGEEIRFNVSRVQFAEAASCAYLYKNGIKHRSPTIVSVRSIEL